MLGIRRSAVLSARQLGVYSSGLTAHRDAEVEEFVVPPRASRKMPVEKSTYQSQRKNSENRFKDLYAEYSPEKVFAEGAAKVHGITPNNSVVSEPEDDKVHGFSLNNRVVSEGEEVPDDVLSFGRKKPEKHKPYERPSEFVYPDSTRPKRVVDSTRYDDDGTLNYYDRVKPKTGKNEYPDDWYASGGAARGSSVGLRSLSRSPEVFYDEGFRRRSVDDSLQVGAKKKGPKMSPDDFPEGFVEDSDLSNPRGPCAWKPVEKIPRSGKDKSAKFRYAPDEEKPAVGGPVWFQKLAAPEHSVETPSATKTRSRTPTHPSETPSKTPTFPSATASKTPKIPSGTPSTTASKDFPPEYTRRSSKASKETSSSKSTSMLSSSTELSADKLIKDSMASIIIEEASADPLTTTKPLSLVARNILMNMKHVERGEDLSSLDKWKGLVRERDAIEVLGNLQETTQMIKFFNWAENQHNFKHNVFTYNTYLNGLVKNKEPDKAYQEFKRMVKEEIFPDKYTYGIVIRGLCLAQKMHEAMKVAKDMDMQRIAPSSLVANFLIAGLCQAGKVNEAFTYFCNLDEKCSAADVISYNLLIHGLCKMNRVDRAVGLFATMLGRNLEPTMITYNVVLYGLCKSGRLKEAVSLLMEMLEGQRGKDIYPDVFTYNTVIDGLCKKNDHARARFVLRRMMKHNVPATVVTYNTLIDGLSRAGNVEEMEEIFRHMQQKQVMPTVVTYTSMINGHCKAKLLEKAREYFQEMTRAGVKPNVFTYTALIRGYCDAGLVNEAVELLKQMSPARVNPNVITYTTIVHSLCKNGDPDRACRIFDEMLKRKIFDPDEYAFITIIMGLCKHNKFGEAYVYWKKMVTVFQFSPDLLVCTKLADGLEAAREFEKMEDVCRISESKGFVLRQLKLPVQEQVFHIDSPQLGI